MTPVRPFIAALAVVATLGVAPAARAQSNKVAAEALFEEGRRLISEGKVAEACPKFADSQSLDPSAGTLLNLASCYEKLGMTASAWATYREAASLAAANGRADLVSVGQKHADTLAPKLSRLSILVPNPVDGMQIQRDGVNVTAAERGVPIPVDPGKHRIDVHAPKKRPWSGTVDIAEAGASFSVTIPALEDAPAEPTPPAPGPAPGGTTLAAAPERAEGGWGTQRTIGAVVAGAGAVGLGVSLVFALNAKSKYNDSLAFCPQDKNVCTDDGVQKRNDARAAGNVATVAFALGATGVAAGAALFIFAPKREAHGAAFEVEAAPTLGGMIVRGRF